MPTNFYPSLVNIIDISNEQQAVVTFDEDHDFTDGEIISLRSSRPYGMYEVNQAAVRVLSHTSDTVTVDLDTSTFNSFVYPASGTVSIPAIAVPAGSGVIPYPASLQSQFNAQPFGTTLLDAFDDRST